MLIGIGRGSKSIYVSSFSLNMKKSISIYDGLITGTKASYRHAELRHEFIYPYDLGWRENLRQVFWRRGNGVWWPVRVGCHQFTLTVSHHFWTKVGT